ncbi:LuxR C-terminal-related transcriptional regulator [Bradyrhizobium canariense]|nr:LuxR C-terminal-related transcriptional regulator [Bradyrhizobium canariense]
MMLALQINEAFAEIDRIELEIGDLPTEVGERFRAATELLRAVGLAFEDDSLAALSIAESCLKKAAYGEDHHVASTLCHFLYWQLGELETFYALPRWPPDARTGRSQTLSAVFNLSIEAAMELEQLHFTTAARLASDAREISEAGLRSAAGLAALPVCLTAQVLYEEGYLDAAEVMLRDKLSAISAQGSVECALRGYLVLARIARHRMQWDLAALLLREAEALGGRRGWPRLVAASIAERALLLLQEGRLNEARACVEHLDRAAQTHNVGSAHRRSEVVRCRTLTYWRVSWAESPSIEAAAAFRLLYHQALERHELYTACQLAIELAGMLAHIGETHEADTLFFRTLQVGSSTGLYQVFMDRGAGVGALLKRAYAYAQGPEPGGHRALLPYLGSLSACLDARDAKRASAKPWSKASDGLSTRECEILALISRGLANKRVAQSLNISPETVKSHIKRIFLKLAVSTRTEAVSRAGELGLL